MNMDCITFRSITPAQRSQRVLRREGVEARLHRTPRSMEQQGCGYCLQIRSSDRERALMILRKANMDFRNVYTVENGERVER